MSVPCCMMGFGDAPDKGTVGLSMVHLGNLGDECAEAQHNMETFQRLSQKPDKSAKVRADAASNAGYWGGVYQDCLNKKAVAEATNVQQQVTQAASATASPAGSPGVVAGAPMDWGTLFTYGGLAIGGSLLLYMLLRRKS